VESSGGGPPRGGIPQGRYQMTKTGFEFWFRLRRIICLIFDICDLEFLIAACCPLSAVSQHRPCALRLVPL